MKRFRPTVPLTLFGLVVLGGGLVGSLETPAASAQSNDPNPRSWAQDDLRVPSRDQIVRGVLRHAVACGVSSSGVGFAIDGMLMKAANSPHLSMATATTLACLAGAPSGATCKQLEECTGENGPMADTAVCDGSVLRSVVLNSRTQEKSPIAVACRAFGDECYTSPLGAFCGSGACESGFTYSCDGDTAIACVQGVLVRKPCGRGMTCGRSPASRVVDCIGEGPSCGKDRCEGTVLHQCMKDSFRLAGLERIVDCADYGLSCRSQGDKAFCAVADKRTECSAKDSPRCTDGQVEVCVTGHWTKLSCADLSLGGSCNSSDSGVITCK